MNEFNPFSLLNKIIKDVSKLNTPQNAPKHQGPAPQPFEAQMPKINMQNNFSKTVDFYSLQAQNMENQQLLNYMKESLNLPKEIKELLAKTLQAQMQGQFKGSFLESKFDLAFFTQILNANAKDATQKIIQAMAEFSKQGIKDVSQLKELLVLIGASLSAAGGETNQAIKNLMLLYLPFLPINPIREDFDFCIKQKPERNGRRRRRLH
jgi:CRISPR/Cas system CMR-associated protein Cmr5 small subunit